MVKVIGKNCHNLYEKFKVGIEQRERIVCWKCAYFIERKDGQYWMVSPTKYCNLTYYCSKMNLRSISTYGMWEIMGQSSPFSFKHLWLRSGQSLIYSCETVSESPLGKNDCSLGHPEIHRCWREVSVWRAREVRDSRFLNLSMER